MGHIVGLLFCKEESNGLLADEVCVAQSWEGEPVGMRVFVLFVVMVCASRTLLIRVHYQMVMGEMGCPVWVQ